MFLAPYKMETTYTRYPIANVTLIVITSILFFLSISDSVTYEDVIPYVLRDWDASQLLGSLFLHGDLFHLLGNMLFLWVFGNAINAAVGNIAYPILYLILGVCAGVTHLSADAHPAIGASGAINGIVGMTLILYPYNKMRTFYWFRFRMGTFETKALWMILCWNVFDVIAVVLGSDDGIGHWAHLGGLAFGMVLALSALRFKLVDTYSPSLLDVLAGRAHDMESEGNNQHREMLTGQLQLDRSITQSLPSVAPAFADDRPPEPAKPVSLEPDLRLTQCVGRGSILTCYIRNQGGPMKNLTLRVPRGVTSRLSPSAAWYRNQSGSIRFQTDDGTTIDSIEFILNFDDADGVKRKLRYRCLSAEKTMAIVPT